MYVSLYIWVDLWRLLGDLRVSAVNNSAAKPTIYFPYGRLK